jgi:hypothetical protein
VFGFALGLLAVVLPSAVAVGLETLPKCAVCWLSFCSHSRRFQAGTTTDVVVD